MMVKRESYLAGRMIVAATLVAAGLLGTFTPAQAANPDAWTQWGGPNRDFTTETTAIATDWPEDGPEVIWRRKLGDGFSTIITDGNTLYTMYRTPSGRPPRPKEEGKKEEAFKKEVAAWEKLPVAPDAVNETIIALDADTGKTIWEHKYKAPYLTKDEKDAQTTQFGEGPNSTPLLVDGRLYTVGFTGIMHCLEAKTGKVLWTKQLYKDLHGTFLYFGYAPSPIAYRDTVIALVGGKGHGVVAFDRKTGDVAWQSTDFDCSYSSPLLVTVDGVDHLVAYMGTHVIGLSPKTGELQWSIEHRNQFATAIVTPVWGPDNMLYFTVGGDKGAKGVRLAKKGDKITATEVWATNKIKGGLHNPVRFGNFVYGDGGGKANIMIGFDITSGEIVWKQRDLPKVKPVGADGKLIMLDEDGQLMVATPTPEGITVHAKAQLLEKPAWTAPTVVGGNAYLRDRKTVMAVRLTAKKKREDS